MHHQALLHRSLSLEPAEPLWRRAPARDTDGGPLSDFMMIIPELRDQPVLRQRRTVDRIQQVLAAYAPVVVFADLNLKLNVLWVTVRPRPGICAELPAAIFACVPEARLVAYQPHRR